MGHTPAGPSSSIGREEGQRFAIHALQEIKFALLEGDAARVQARLITLRGLMNADRRRTRFSEQFLTGVRDVVGDQLELLDRIAA